MHTPPFPGSASSTSSGTLRGTSHSALAEEWLKTTGRVDTRNACRMVSAETCDRSTSTPMRFISRTTCSPKSFSPPSTGSSVAESAHGTLSLWVSVMYRTPSARIIRSVPSDSLMECPPSMPSSDAIRPEPNTARTSAAESAITRWSG